MKKKYLRKTSLILILTLTSSFVLISLPTPMTVNKVQASFISDEDIKTGLSIALLLVLFKKIQGSRENPIEEDIINDNFSKRKMHLTEEDINLLARAIHGEARGESFKGQVAVGAVILNRLKSPEFPNNIKDIIYQEKQFSAVKDGQFYLTPNKTAYTAAERAIAGEDPSEGALYFYNPKTATTLWWLETREKTVEIENHVFAK
ncbi:MAG: cell wall hydrolase [bacterium]